jgi:hypothetical protein
LSLEDPVSGEEVSLVGVSPPVAPLVGLVEGDCSAGGCAFVADPSEEEEVEVDVVVAEEEDEEPGSWVGWVVPADGSPPPGVGWSEAGGVSICVAAGSSAQAADAAAAMLARAISPAQASFLEVAASRPDLDKEDPGSKRDNA